jgi:hypothetical protein
MPGVGLKVACALSGWHSMFLLITLRVPCTLRLPHRCRAARPFDLPFQNAFEVRVRAPTPRPSARNLDAGVPMAADITREAGCGLRLAPGSVLGR